MDLQGATALVTGGARRLGRQISLDLARAGMRVVVNFHSSQREAEEVVAEITTAGGEAIAVRADASRPEQTQHMIDETIARFGRIDILVANAAVFRRTPLATCTDADWDELLRFNVDLFRVPAHRIGLAMKHQGRGCIIAIADTAGLRPWSDYAPYCAAKAAVISLTLSFARALAPEVRVNAIAPGPILFPADGDEHAYRQEIQRTLLRRQGEAANVSDAVLFLARNDYVTGAVLPVDGGRLLV